MVDEVAVVPTELYKLQDWYFVGSKVAALQYVPYRLHQSIQSLIAEYGVLPMDAPPDMLLPHNISKLLPP